MASPAAFVALRAACLVVLVVGKAPPAAFDPPFAFPAFEGTLKVKGATPPTETSFVKGCFSYVYGLLHKAGKELYKKPAELPDVLMKNCRQENKKGCHRLAQQLQHIVEAKEKEGPIGHRRHVKSKAALKAAKNVKVENTDKKTVSKVNAVGTADSVAKVDQTVPKIDKSKPVAPPKPQHHKHKPGARVKAEDLQDESFVQQDGQAQASNDPVAGQKRLGLVVHESQRRPLRYTDWCTNLYSIATATYEPTKAKAPVPTLAKASPPAAKASAAPAKALTNVSSTNTTAVKAKVLKSTNATAAHAAPKAPPAKNATAVKPKVEAAKNATVKEAKILKKTSKA